MSALGVKRRRDIGRQKGQFIAVLVTVTLGVMLFAGTFNAYLNLEESLEGTYDRLGMADMTVTDPDETFAGEVTGVDGVAEASTRRRADVPMQAGEFTFIGRVIGYPTDGDPALNRVDIDEGSGLDPDDPSAVLLETHAASDFDIEVGDTLLIAGQEATVVGVATSPEYLWPARDRQSIFTPPKSFGVVFAAEEILATLESPTVEDQVLVRYDEGVDTETVDADVTALAEAAGAADIETLEDQPSNATVHLEISGLRTMALALPLLFLAAAGMAIYVVITRLVYAQRGVIGTLRASGFTRRRMAAHYRGYGIGVGLAGAAIGAALGSLLARGMTAIYTTVFGIPDLVARFHLPTLLIALSFGAIAGLLAAEAPARAVARLAPAEAMRGDTPTEDGKRSILERLVPPLRRAPVRWRMSVRGIGRNKRRSASLVAGVVLGLTLILASWGMLDTMISAMDRQFNEIAVEDASVVFDSPVGEAQIDTVVETAGVSHAEPVVGLRATVGSEDDTYTTLLEAYQDGTRVRGFGGDLPASGVLLGQATEDVLDLSEGDPVTIALPDLDTEIDTTVGGFIDEPMATMAYLRIEVLEDALTEADAGDAATALRAPTFTTARALFDDGADSAVVTSRLRDTDGVAAAVDANEIRDLIASFQVFFYVFVGMMLAFGGAMAFALIFNIISVNVAERAGEFASMRANGLSHRRVASLIVGETFLLTAIGIIPGLLVGYVAAAAFMNSFSSDQFPIAVDIRWFTYLGAAVAMFVVAGLSLMPALRSVKRIDVARIVRERAT